MDRNEVLRWLDRAADEQYWWAGTLRENTAILRAAAELIRAGGWRPIAEAPEGKELIVGVWRNGNWCIAEGFDKRSAIASGKTHHLPEPEPPAREVAR